MANFKRIVSLAPSNTEIIFAIGAEKNLVGVTAYCDFPPEAKSLHKTGLWTSSQNLDAIERLKPDLLLASMFVPQNVREWSEGNGIRLVKLFPQTIGQVNESILEIGGLCGKEKNAVKAVHGMTERLEAIKAESEKLSHKPKIYSEEFNDPPTVAQNWVPELIEIAGGVPMGKSGELSREVSAKAVGAFNPDAIVLHWCGFGNRQEPASLESRLGWKNIPAVRAGRIFALHDSLLNRPSPRMVEGCELLQKIFGLLVEA
ncbi:MAG: cobalamin-binding protein [Candidatus Diapherotrites archaeon]|nr:cobalamin-binding protein [Candidatus Diapherotrites archaeon]